MKAKQIHRFLAVAALVVLVATACAPAVARVPDVIETKDVLRPVSRELKSGLELGGDGDPGIEANMPTAPTASVGVVAAQAGDVEALQDRLTLLYRQANPSVVFIVVTDGGTGFATSGGSGTGWVYGEDGTIVTNNHVVRAGSTYEVVFPNGDRMAAELIGADPDSELAVLDRDRQPIW
jgi:S1-C subfamily serine protease